MLSRRTKVSFVVGLTAIVCAGALLAWWHFVAPFNPSALIADTALVNMLQKGVLQDGLNILARNERWNRDDAKGQFARSFECTVLHKDNLPFDPRIVCAHLEEAIRKLVKVDLATDDSAGPAELHRVIRYEAKQTTGEVRYQLKPVPGATLVVNGIESKGNFHSLEIQVTEHRKR